jgi:short-subunit dehydrogenase
MDPTTEKPFAVVTGASSGIGFALAKEFARHGFALVIAAENAELTDAERELKTLGAAVDAVQVDLATPQGVETLVERVNAHNQPVTALVVNAGVGVSGDFARKTDLDAELNLIDLNVRSTVHLTKRLVRPMVDRKRGRVLFTSSIAAMGPGPFYATYAASKAFMLSFAEAIREELKDTGVTVTALMPGATDTKFFERAGMEDTKVGAGKKDDPAEVARQGFEALMAGKDHVIAGSFVNKIRGAASKLMPETLKAAAQRRSTEPGSAHH